jgi:hypothetical protein
VANVHSPSRPWLWAVGTESHDNRRQATKDEGRRAFDM